MKRLYIKILCLVGINLLFSLPVFAAEQILTMSTTTSTQASGLLDRLLPEFEKDTGIRVKVIAKGTGAAIRDGIDGNVDVIFVHDREREDEFVKKGYGTRRYAVMHNDFVILGPSGDPAKVKGCVDVTYALKRIAETRSPFVSRGDDSGTHAKEQALWKSARLPLDTQSITIVKNGKNTRIDYIQPKGAKGWYLSIGQGMGKAITYAEEKQAYVLADRGTFIKYKYGRPDGLDLDVLCEGDKGLANPYGVIPVSPQLHPHVKYDLAETFANWLISPRGQGIIEGYQLLGKPLFFGDASH